MWELLDLVNKIKAANNEAQESGQEQLIGFNFMHEGVKFCGQVIVYPNVKKDDRSSG
jgi:hypothetical protein